MSRAEICKLERVRHAQLNEPESIKLPPINSIRRRLSLLRSRGNTSYFHGFPEDDPDALKSAAAWPDPPGFGTFTHFFISHRPCTGADQVYRLCHEMKMRGYSVN